MRNTKLWILKMFSICFCFGPPLIRSTISLILRKYAEATWKVGVHQSNSDFRLPLFYIERSAMTVHVLLCHMHQLTDARVAGCHWHICSVCCNALEAVLCAGFGEGGASRRCQFKVHQISLDWLGCRSCHLETTHTCLCSLVPPQTSAIQTTEFWSTLFRVISAPNGENV